ncbi:MAG: hypothetical protein KDL87_06145 [Verrucomicrobiae bacterium]|nr:hypothetical protein [Verrucomicrobiae bacterium]
MLACQVPVFRFALERWVPDAYHVTVAPGPSGQFSADEQAAIDFLKSQMPDPRADGGVFANLIVETATEPAADFPGAKMTIGYPQKGRGFAIKPIWQGSLDLENAKRLVDSPARRELVKEILHGESAVWILVESGNADADNAAAETVTTSIAQSKETLRVPDGVMTRQQAESAENFAAVNADDILRSEVPLKIDFSLIRIRRDDPAEAMFLPMLLNIEDDLGDFVSEPMVFPVFGRGRLLEPLIGKGVRSENVMEYATYICGACSCEVKDQNPGVDLLIAADWDTALHGSEVVIDKVLPPLEGTGIFTAVAKTDPGAADEGASPAAAPAEKGSADPAEIAVVSTTPATTVFPLKTLLIAVGILVVVIGVGTVAMLRRNTP